MEYCFSFSLDSVFGIQAEHESITYTSIEPSKRSTHLNSCLNTTVEEPNGGVGETIMSQNKHWEYRDKCKSIQENIMIAIAMTN